MEEIVGLILLCLLIAGLYVFVRALQVGSLDRRLKLAEAQLREVRSELRRLETRTPAETPAASPEEQPAAAGKEATGDPRPEVVDAPAPALHEPEPVDAAPRTEEPVPAPSADGAPTLARVASPEPQPQAPSIAAASATRAQENMAASPQAQFDWERWLGVRGAALLGGIGLALAGVLFVRHAIEQGWLGPLARVLLTASFGALCLAALGPIKRRGYEMLGEALGGAGSVMLYGAAWASYRLYGLLPLAPAFACMAATTAVAVWLSERYRSRVVVTFAAVGGFATPILLGTWRGNPLGFFGYALLLDLGLLLTARRRGWAWMEWVALTGTIVLELLWVFTVAERGNASVGVIALFGFAGLFAVATGRVTRFAGVLTAFALAFLYALRLDLDVELWQLGIGLVPMTALLAWSSRENEDSVVVLLGAGATAGLALAWLLKEPFAPGRGWQFVGVLAAAGAALTGVVRRWDGGDRPLAQRPEAGVLLLAVSLSAGLFAAAVPPRVELNPWLAGAAGFAALGLGFAVATDQAVLRALPVLGLAAGIGLVYVAGLGAAGIAGLLAALAIGFALWRHPSGSLGRTAMAATAAAVLAPVLLSLPMPEPGQEAVLHLSSGPVLLLALGALGLAGSLVGRHPWIYRVHAVVLAIAWLRWDMALRTHHLDVHLGLGEGLIPLGLRLALALVLLIPLLRGLQWSTIALAPALFWVPLIHGWAQVHGGRHAYLLPLGLGLCALAGTFLVRSRDLGQAALARHGTVAWSLLILAGARLLDWTWAPTGAALAFAGGALIARRQSHWRLFHVCTWGLATSFGWLLVTALLSSTLPSSAWLVSPSLVWSFVFPAAAGAWLLSRDRGWFEGIERSVLGIGVTLLVFAWINLVVFDAYEPEARIYRDFTRSQSQNLVQSLAWVIFALALLGAGTWARLGSLRWMSLAVLMAALAKVGLWDLGELTGLFRIASIAGLAVALLAVSVLYQRFVFRTVGRAASQGAPVEGARSRAISAELQIADVLDVEVGGGLGLHVDDPARALEGVEDQSSGDRAPILEVNGDLVRRTRGDQQVVDLLGHQLARGRFSSDTGDGDGGSGDGGGLSRGHGRVG